MKPYPSNHRHKRTILLHLVAFWVRFLRLVKAKKSICLYMQTTAGARAALVKARQTKGFNCDVAIGSSTFKVSLVWNRQDRRWKQTTKKLHLQWFHACCMWHPSYIPSRRWESRGKVVVQQDSPKMLFSVFLPKGNIKLLENVSDQILFFHIKHAMMQTRKEWTVPGYCSAKKIGQTIKTQHKSVLCFDTTSNALRTLFRDIMGLSIRANSPFHSITYYVVAQNTHWFYEESWPGWVALRGI